MTKKILVAVDGSDHDEATLKRAIELSKADDAQLIILHAVVPHALSDEEVGYAEVRCGKEFKMRLEGAELPEFPVEDGDAAIPFRRYVAARNIFFRVLGEDILKRAAESATAAGLKSIKTELEFQDPAKAILVVADREDVDTIVMGRRGHNPIVEFFLGSTAQKVLHHSDRTVVLVAQKGAKE